MICWSLTGGSDHNHNVFSQETISSSTRPCHCVGVWLSDFVGLDGTKGQHITHIQIWIYDNQADRLPNILQHIFVTISNELWFSFDANINKRIHYQVWHWNGQALCWWNSKKQLSKHVNSINNGGHLIFLLAETVQANTPVCFARLNNSYVKPRLCF